MGRPREHTFGVTLSRNNVHTPWGVRIMGGADLGTPITVMRVQSGSPSEKGLQVGDVIVKMGDYDARDISHQDAMRLFQDAGTIIKLDIKRDANIRTTRSRSSDLHMHADEPSRSSSGQQKIIFPPPNPICPNTSASFPAAYSFREDEETEYISKQPYRTTPLVLPGAKAKHEKELAPTHSYLRHHPNRMMRAPPPQYELLPQEVVMKQKVADSIIQKMVGDDAFAGKQVVNKQFNTPIGLYSNQNIVDTIHNQAGLSAGGVVRTPFVTGTNVRTVAPKKTVVYDPSKSETFKALQEEQYTGQQVQEVTAPPQSKVFSPNTYGKKVQHQAPQAHTYDPLSRSTASPNLHHHMPYVNSMGQSEERIAQSGSFKRLMNLVMADANY